MEQKDKEFELKKYRDLVITTIDFYLDNKSHRIKTNDFDSDEHFRTLKLETEEHYNKGRLTKLKQWFKDLTEQQIECKNLKFNDYLNQNTDYDVNIFQSYLDNIEKIIEKGRITTVNQYYDLNLFVDQLCQIEQADKEKINRINLLLANFNRTKKRNTN